MSRYEPMLAKPLSANADFDSGKYWAEEKFDGHRLLVSVSDGDIQSWSRTGKNSERKLSPKLKAALQNLPNGVYDGELVVRGTTKSYSVARLENFLNLQYVVFDVLELHGDVLTHLGYSKRRILLENAVVEVPEVLQLSKTQLLHSPNQLFALAREIWERNGEGVIVKHGDAPYRPGKRTDAFMKLKQVRQAVVTIVEFLPSSGEVFDRGTCAVTVCQDDEGTMVTVKTKDDATCRRLEQDPQSYIGRRLMIEYMERAETGGYISPRWDRFEDE